MLLCSKQLTKLPKSNGIWLLLKLNGIWILLAVEATVKLLLGCVGVKLMLLTYRRQLNYNVDLILFDQKEKDAAELEVGC